jgi:hypothetical protein
MKSTVSSAPPHKLKAEIMSINTKSAADDASHEDSGSIGGYDGIDDWGAEKSTFPIDCLPGIAGEMAREVARVSTCQNVALSASTVLGIVSASIGASLEVASGPNRKTRANIYVLPVAKSGTGKSEIFKPLCEPLAALETTMMKSWETVDQPEILSLLATCEARIKRLIEKASKSQDLESRQKLTTELRDEEANRNTLNKRLAARPCLCVGDATKEKLAVIMQGQPGEALSSLSSEARGIINVVKGRYSVGGDIDFYTAAYSGDPITVDRMKNQDRIRLENPCLSILWMVQDDVADWMFSDPEMSKSGFMARFIAFDPHAEAICREANAEPISESNMTKWGDLIRDLHSLRGHGGAITVAVSADANEHFRLYGNENIQKYRTGGDLANISSYVSRWTENARRLGLVLHGALHGNQSGDNELSVETARSAVRLMRWFSNAQVDLLANANRKQTYRRILNLEQIVQAKGQGELTMRSLVKDHGFSATEVNTLVKLHPERVSIRPRQNPRGGPTSIIVSLTPNCQNPQYPQDPCNPPTSPAGTGESSTTTTIPFFLARVG